MHSARILGDACAKLHEYSIDGINLDQNRIDEFVSESIMLVTALYPIIGYDKASATAHRALDLNTTLREATLSGGFIGAEEFESYGSKEDVWLAICAVTLEFDSDTLSKLMVHCTEPRRSSGDFLFVMLICVAGSVNAFSFWTRSVFTKLMWKHNSLDSIPSSRTLYKGIAWNICLCRLYSSCDLVALFMKQEKHNTEWTKWVTDPMH